jgi:multidrug efflux pump
MDAVFGWFFRGFNRAFGAGSNAYGKGVGGLLSRKSIVMVIYLALAGATYSLFNAVPAASCRRRTSSI